MPRLPLTSTRFLHLPGAILWMMCLLLLSTILQAQSSAPASRDQLIKQIQSFADQDVEGGAPLDDKEVIQLFQNNKFGLSAYEISTVYRQRYLEDKKKKKPWPQRLPLWLYGLVLVLAFFWKPLKSFIEDTLKKAYEAVYVHYAGAKIFRGRALRRYRKSIVDQHSKLKIPFRETPLNMRDIYVPLRMSETGSSASIEGSEAVRNHRRLMVKGVPGAGKSMLLRALLLAYADGRLEGIEHDPVPVLVELSRLNDATTGLRAQLIQTFQLYGFPKADAFVDWALEHDGLLLLLDGLDEVNAQQRPRVAQLVKDLVNQYQCRVIITCRTQVYRNEFSTLADRTLEVAEFSDRDIYRFLQPWATAMSENQSVEQLMQILRDRPTILALARNPLLLAMIAYLYADMHRTLPQSRASFYEESTDLLLQRWAPELNLLKNAGPAKFAVLAKLALRFQEQPAGDQDRRSLDEYEVLKLVRDVLPGTAVDVANSAELLGEIVERNGLLLRIDNGARYQFTHLTLQEYFAARALGDNPLGLLGKFKTDRDTWREVVKLWCGLTADASGMVDDIAALEPITAIECLADAKLVKPEVADRVLENAKNLLSSTYVAAATAFLGSTRSAAVAAQPAPQPAENGWGLLLRFGEFSSAAKAFGLLAGKSGARGEAVLDWLTQQLDEPDGIRRESAAVALASSNLELAARRLLAHKSATAATALDLMGDVAVRPLAQGKYVAQLVKIGTPRALEEVVKALWDADPNVHMTASVYVSRVLQVPATEAILRDIPAAALGPMAEDFAWIWEPFEKPPVSSLPVITGRIAHLLAENPLPAYWIAQQPNSKIPETMDARIALPLYAATKHKVFLEKLGKEPSVDLQERFMELREPQKDDWLRVFQPTVFNFGKSKHFRFAQLLLAIMSIFLVFCLYQEQMLWLPVTWWKTCVAVVLVIDFFVLGASIANRSVNLTAMLGSATLAEIRSLRQNFFDDDDFWGHVLIGSIVVCIAAYLPSVLYFCSLELHKHFSWPVIGGFWICIYALGGGVWWLGRRKERFAKNPLQGLVQTPAYVKTEIASFDVFGLKWVFRSRHFSTVGPEIPPPNAP